MRFIHQALRPFFSFRLAVATGLLCAILGAISSANAQINPTILSQISTMTFQHQGALNTTAELAFIKAQIAAGVEPWASNFSKMANSPSASLTYTPSTWATSTLLTNGGQVWEGISDIPDAGGTALMNDSQAAYTQALMWEFTANPIYAQNAIAIMNAWSANLKSLGGPAWYLLAGWSGGVFPLAAEIIRNTYPYNATTNPSGWTTAGIAQFTAMLNTVYLPELNERYGFGNREFACDDALCAIGVFNNDRAAFYQGIRHWMSYFPCYVYMTADGSLPILANYWITTGTNAEPTPTQYCAMDVALFPNPTPANCWILASNGYPPADVNPPAYPTEGGPYGDDSTAMLYCYNNNDPEYVWYGATGTTGPFGSAPYQGVCAETCRDLGHVENSISEVFAVAEMARVQGFDIYTGSDSRLAAFLEMNSSLRLGNPMPGGFAITQQNLTPTYEIGYNHLVNVLGMSLPHTQQLINPILRWAQWFYITWGVADYYHEIIPTPAGLSTNCLTMNGQSTYSGWETLTHGDLNGSSPGPDPDVAFGQTATASSTSGTFVANNATDGNLQTNWQSARSDPQWIYVDLKSTYNITGVTLYWDTTSCATAYSVQTSNDTINWTTVWSTTSGAGGVVRLTGLSASGRYVRMYGTARNSTYSYTLDQFQVFGTPALPTAGLVADYEFEQNANDSSGLGNNGTAETGLSYSTNAAVGAYSGQFNGTGGRVDVPNSTSLQITGNLTLACWVDPTAISGSQDLIAKSYNSAYRLILTSTGQLELVLGNTSGGTNLVYSSSTQLVPAGTWTHVAVTVSFSGSTATVYFYINGVAQTAQTTTLSSINAGTGILVLGCSEDADNQPLNGKLDEVLIYNVALSAAQIAELAQ